MKKTYLIIIVLLSLTACQGEAIHLTATQESIRATEKADLFNSLLETAIFETQVVLQLTEMVPTATLTTTPTLTLTPTLEPSATPEGRVRNIWALQDECDPFDPDKCINYRIYNREPSNMPYKGEMHSIHISLKNTSTGEEAYFVIPYGVVVKIALFPGEYQATYYMDCEEEEYYSRTWAITERTDWFYCAKQDRFMTYGGVISGP